MVRRLVLAGCVLAPLLAGCELGEVTVGTRAPTVVVHAVLNPDADEQVILVENSLTGRVDVTDNLRFNPLDPIRTGGGDPLTGADVRLLTGTDTVGVRATETVVQNRPTGRYVVPRARLAIVPGRSYRLRVRAADGRTVTGETLVPGAPPGWAPGSGTVPVPVPFTRATDTLRLAWTPVAGARTYGVRIETPNGPWFLFSDSTRFALAGSLRNFFADGLPSVFYPGFRQVASVVAVDRNFFDYNRSGNDPFGGTGLISSVQGGIGLFGSIVGLLRREVQVTDRDRLPLDARWVGADARGVPVEYDLWVETPGDRARVSGRVRTSANRFLWGILEGTTLRLATLSTISAVDTVAFFTGRVVGDSIIGSYDGRFATDGPTRLRRAARLRP